jgi:hypothetical protein
MVLADTPNLRNFYDRLLGHAKTKVGRCRLNQ